MLKDDWANIRYMGFNRNNEMLYLFQQFFPPCCDENICPHFAKQQRHLSAYSRWSPGHNNIFIVHLPLYEKLRLIRYKIIGHFLVYMFYIMWPAFRENN